MEIGKTKVLAVSLILVFSLTLVHMTMPVKAQHHVKVYVDQPLGFIPGVAVGGKVTVDTIIEVSGIFDNTPESIVGWLMNIAVDPTVLGIYAPPQYRGATGGYFLYDFAFDQGYSTPTLSPGTANPNTGYWTNLGEVIMPTPPGGAGDGYSGRKLVTLFFYSKSNTAYSRIDLMEVKYVDATGTWHPVDEVVGGNYNLPEVPEFPIGLAFEILFIPVIIYVFWRNKQRKKMLP